MHSLKFQRHSSVFRPVSWPWCGTTRTDGRWWNKPRPHPHCSAHGQPRYKQHPRHSATSTSDDTTRTTVVSLQRKRNAPSHLYLVPESWRIHTLLIRNMYKRFCSGNKEELSVLTFLNKQVGESEHHSVSTVEEVSTQEMRICNRQTSSWDQAQDSLDFSLGVSMELMGKQEVGPERDKQINTGSAATLKLLLWIIVC